MRKFILRSMVFFGLSIIFLSIFQIILIWPKKRLLTMPQGATTVFLGNSTVEGALVDSIIPGTYNFARSAETYDMIYAKLKLLKNYNPKLKNVIVTLDGPILYSDTYISHGSPKAVLLEQFSGKDWLNNFKYYSVESDKQFISTLYHFYNIRPMLLYTFGIPGGEENYLGGFRPIERNNLENDLEEIKNGGDLMGYETDLPPWINIYYLDKIVDYCRKNDLDLVFLTTPRHKSIWYDTRYIDFYNNLDNGIPLLDFYKEELPDSFYADVTHLNQAGAIYFSKKLKEKLRL